MNIDIDVLSKVISSSHLSMSKSRSTGMLFICSAHNLKLIKGQKCVGANALVVGLGNLWPLG